MGKPSRCAPRQKPFISYNIGVTTTSTTSEPDFSNYLIIPNSGEICPTTTIAPTTTVPPRVIDPNFPCSSYSFLPEDNNGAVITFSPCDNNSSVNQIIVGSVQRLDFCAENDGDVKILSGNGTIVFNNGCSRFSLEEGTTTTTTSTSTTTTTNAPNKLYKPSSLNISGDFESCFNPIEVQRFIINFINDIRNIEEYPYIPLYKITIEITESINTNIENYFYFYVTTIFSGGSQEGQTNAYCPTPNTWYRARAKVEAYDYEGKLSEYEDSDYKYSDWYYSMN